MPSLSETFAEENWAPHFCWRDWTGHADSTAGCKVLLYFAHHLKDTYYAFFVLFHSIGVLNMFLYMKNILKVKTVSPTIAPLFHKKHCTWNASSVFPALILSLGDIALRHHVTHLHNLCLAVSFAQKKKKRFNAAVLLLVVLAQTFVSWPVRADWVLRRGTLRRQELKHSISDRGGIQSCSTKQYEKTDVMFEH